LDISVSYTRQSSQLTVGPVWIYTWFRSIFEGAKENSGKMSVGESPLQVVIHWTSADRREYICGIVCVYSDTCNLEF
jgi:hypothetical protein